MKGTENTENAALGMRSDDFVGIRRSVRSPLGAVIPAKAGIHCDKPLRCTHAIFPPAANEPDYGENNKNRQDGVEAVKITP